MKAALLRSRASVIVLVALAFASSVDAQGNRAALVARLDSLARAGVDENRTAGLSVAVIQGRDTLLLEGYGRASIELDVPTPDRAVYEIGSVTKQFTAAAILQLRDEGKLDLDDDVTKYLPDYPTHGRRIPIRRLLDHTSGIKGITEIAAFRTLFHRGWPQDSVVALFGREPLEFTTGDAMIYNNSAYILLGHIIEKVSGMTYERYIEDRIFGQLGMKDSRYCSIVEVVPRRTTGYTYQGTNVRRAPDNDHSLPYSAGSLCSTAGDMVTWLHALHGGRVLSPRSYTEMTTPATLNDGTPLRYGMGLSVGRDVRGAMVIGHGGAITGFTAYAGWYPDAQLAVVVLMNSGGAISPEAIASELVGEIIPPVRPVLRPFAGTDAAALPGRYAGPARGREMVVEVTQNAQGILMTSVNGASAQPIPWMEGWTFGRNGSPILTFVRTGTTGPATALRYDAGGGYYILKRVQ